MERIAVVGFSLKSTHSLGYRVFNDPVESVDEGHRIESFIMKLLVDKNADVISIRRVKE